MSQNKGIEENSLLIKKAKEAKNNSYSPYSKFRVGAALLAEAIKYTQAVI